MGKTINEAVHECEELGMSQTEIASSLAVATMCAGMCEGDLKFVSALSQNSPGVFVNYPVFEGMGWDVDSRYCYYPIRLHSLYQIKKKIDDDSYKVEDYSEMSEHERVRMIDYLHTIGALEYWHFCVQTLRNSGGEEGKGFDDTWVLVGMSLADVNPVSTHPQISLLQRPTRTETERNVRYYFHEYIEQMLSIQNNENITVKVTTPEEMTDDMKLVYYSMCSMEPTNVEIFSYKHLIDEDEE